MMIVFTMVVHSFLRGLFWGLPAMDIFRNSMGLLAFFGEYSTNYSASMAGICLTTITIIIAYVLFQEMIENGLMSGAVKG